MNIPPRRILVLVGPTAAGKTALSLRLAQKLDAEILSADSRQVYKYLDIGTAKPSPEARLQVPHHFVDLLPPDQEFNAGMFGEQGRIAVEEIFARGKVPLVVGGSGLYVKSLIDGLFAGPGADPELRRELEARLELSGIESLVAELRRVDPDSAARIDPTKPRRVIRALEVHALTGRPMSELHREGGPSIAFESVQVGLRWEREALYRRIETRCDRMLNDGLLTEIGRLAEWGYDRRINSLNTVGYAEGFAYRAGETGYEEMVRLFKQNSRRYAKRQMTWFRADTRVHWLAMAEASDLDAVAAEAEAHFFAPMP